MTISRISDFNSSQSITPSPQENGGSHGNSNTENGVSNLVTKVKRFVNGKRENPKEEFSEKSKVLEEVELIEMEGIGKPRKLYQFEDLHPDVKPLIVKEAIFKQDGSLRLRRFCRFRLVSKAFKRFVNSIYG